MISQFITNLLSQIRFKHLFWIFYYFFLFFLLLNNSFNYFDPDFGWHLKAGEEIVMTGEVPSQNHYNYTYRGNWVDHEWLGDLWLYKAYSSFGYVFVSIFFALLIVFVLAALSRLTIKRWPEASPLVLVLVQTFGLLAALPSLGVRLQEFGLLFIFLLLVIIHHFERQRRPLILALFPVVFYLWAALHASFLLGLFLMFSWLIIKLGEKIISWSRFSEWVNREKLLTLRQGLIYSFWSLVAVAATMITPYKLELFAFLGGYQDSFYQTHIREWLPQYSFPFHYKQLIYLALVAAASILYLKYRNKKTKLDFWQLFLILLFFVMSWKARRHFPLLFIATLPYLVFMVSSLISENRDKGSWRFNIWLKAYLIICLLLSTISLALSTKFTMEPFSSYCQDYPCGAAQYLADYPEYDKLNLFNNYGWGGYLIWQLPDRQLFIDGRLPQVEFAGKTFLEEYYDFFAEATDKKQKLNSYNIDLVLIQAEDKPRPIKNWEKKIFMINDSDLEVKNHLRDHLESAGWVTVYRDKTAVIYERP